jgi:hypothetical protein
MTDPAIEQLETGGAHLNCAAGEFPEQCCRRIAIVTYILWTHSQHPRMMNVDFRAENHPAIGGADSGVAPCQGLVPGVVGGRGWDSQDVSGWD